MDTTTTAHTTSENELVLTMGPSRPANRLLPSDHSTPTSVALGCRSELSSTQSTTLTKLLVMPVLVAAVGTNAAASPVLTLVVAATIVDDVCSAAGGESGGSSALLWASA